MKPIASRGHRDIDIVKASNPARNTDSPCIRHCCLDQQDRCVGCKRTLNEILEWSDASPQRKAEIVAHCRVRALESRQF